MICLSTAFADPRPAAFQIRRDTHTATTSDRQPEFAAPARFIADEVSSIFTNMIRLERCLVDGQILPIRGKSAVRPKFGCAE